MRPSKLRRFTELRRALQRGIKPSRHLSWLVIALTLGILGGSIAWATVHLRQKIRGQILGRDGAILHAVAVMQQLSDETEQRLGSQVENLADQFAITLQISQLRGVIAARLFDADGRFNVSFPGHVREAALDAPALETLRQLRPVSRFRPAGRVAEVFLPGAPSGGRPEKTAPLLEVAVPLHRRDQSTLAGIAQFVIDGEDMAREFAALDRNLLLQAALAFLAGAAILVIALSWAFQRLGQSNALLRERTRSLLRANEELALAAKTSALGAVAAHLIHGLSSPLSGLQDFVTGTAREALPDEEWDKAVASTQRMRRLVEEVVRVLSEEQAGERYEVTLSELAEIVATRTAPAAKHAAVELKTKVQGEGVLANHEANLTVLILENLIHNAIQASASGQTVTLTVACEQGPVAFEVADAGRGLAPEMASTLFAPCRSTKRGGSGIGLAICKQLANHLEADLCLKQSSSEGCTFVLRLPRSRLAQAETATHAPTPNAARNTGLGSPQTRRLEGDAP